MPDEFPAEQMQLDGGLFEEVEYLDIQPDEGAVKDESLEAATNETNEQNLDDEDPLGACLSVRADNIQNDKFGGEDHKDVVAVKGESFDMGTLDSSLNANESNDCVIVSEYSEGIQTANVRDDKDALGACLSVRAENIQNQSAGEDHKDFVAVNESNESNDCVIISEYSLLDVADGAVKKDEIDETDI